MASGYEKRFTKIARILVLLAGLSVFGVARTGGEMVFNPSGDYIFNENDVLIGNGSEDRIARLRKRL